MTNVGKTLKHVTAANLFEQTSSKMAPMKGGKLEVNLFPRNPHTCSHTAGILVDLFDVSSVFTFSVNRVSQHLVPQQLEANHQSRNRTCPKVSRRDASPPTTAWKLTNEAR